jgi:hypothetical protein
MDASSRPQRARLQRRPDGGSAAHDLSRPVLGRLLASWQRSQDYGVSPDTVEPVFTGTLDDTSLFFQCGLEVLTDLHRSLAGEPVSLMLTDPAGLVLNRLSGDHALLRTLDAVHLAPGFAYSEREAGTNGVGLALADRVATLVRAEEHYATSLCGYTCAAVPVIDPVTGRLEGSINLTTWADTGGGLLLALAQSAAGNTQALMLNRSLGRAPLRAPRGEVFRVEPSRLEPGSGRLTTLSTAWTAALEVATGALVQQKVVAAIGEPGSGRTTLLAQALRAARPRGRILAASAPDPVDVAGAVDAGARQAGHHGGRPRRRHVAHVGGRPPARPLRPRPLRSHRSRWWRAGPGRDDRRVRRDPRPAGVPRRDRRGGAPAP